MERDSFVFYRSFYKALKGLDAEDFKETILAVCEYALDGNETDLDGVPYMAFELIRPQINANNTKYTSGLMGGRPKKLTEKPLVFENDETEKPLVFENGKTEKPNENENVNENENEIKKSISYEIPKEKPQRFFPPTPEEVRAYASEKGYTNVDADRFCDFYGSKGWVVGKTKMKDWKAAVRNWNRSQREETPKAVRQETTAKRTRFVNYDQRVVDYDAMLREGDWR